MIDKKPREKDKWRDRLYCKYIVTYYKLLTYYTCYDQKIKNKKGRKIHEYCYDIYFLIKKKK